MAGTEAQVSTKINNCSCDVELGGTMNQLHEELFQTALDLPRPLFGQLAREGVGLTEAQLKECLEYQKKEGGRLGEILCERGLLTHQQILFILRIQATAVAKEIASSAHQVAFPRRTFLSLCLPAYNEEANIADTVLAACAILPEFVTRFEIIVVDDGSTDRTGEIVRRLAERFPQVRLVTHAVNRGYGGAVATGMRAAKGDLVAFMDSDGQFCLLDLPHLLVRTNDHDVVFGYRYNRADSVRRLVMAWGWGRLVGWVLGVRIRDLDCALKLFPRRVVDRLKLDSTSPAINAEILLQCVRGGLSIAQTPVNHYPRYHGVAAGCGTKMILRAFKDLYRLWRFRFDPSLTLKEEEPVDLAEEVLAVTPSRTRKVGLAQREAGKATC
jgi:hypothetical protein